MKTRLVKLNPRTRLIAVYNRMLKAWIFTSINMNGTPRKGQPLKAGFSRDFKHAVTNARSQGYNIPQKGWKKPDSPIPYSAPITDVYLFNQSYLKKRACTQPRPASSQSNISKNRGKYKKHEHLYKAISISI